MKNLIFAAAMSCMVCACGQQAADTDNPFLSEFETPYGTPDFDRIKVEHYEPAFLKGIKQQNEEIKAIVENPEEPSFENTIVALDNSGEILARVSGVFFALTEADTNDEMMALEAKIAPMLSEHSDNIFLNQELYKRVAAVHAQEEAGKIQLTTEQHYLLDKYYKEFVRSGAGLDAQKQERLREINKQLSTLTIEFGNHVLADNNDYLLVVDKKEDLAGLPDAVIAGAAQEAKAHGKDGKWVFTLQESSRTPLLQYAQNRELRKNIYQAYTSLGNRGNANDNKEVLKKVLALRLEKAQLMGFNNFAEYQLADNMAKNPKNALDLLYGLWEYSIKNAKAEAAELQKIMDREGKSEKLEAWDWWYYAEKLRQKKYDLNEDAIKPYFSQEDVHDGLCTVVNKLYGITLTPCDSISVYNKDVKTYIVKDADGSLLGVFYSDYMPRASKRSGAWMSNFREQQEGVRPLIYNVASFTKPAGDLPSLLTIDEARTMYHEFGHALHGLLTQCKYKGVSGTSVAQDFVELPSQIMEHWAVEPEVLKMYAKHYQTREAIPDSLIAKIENQALFNQGFMTTELLAAAILDMEMHCLTTMEGFDVLQFEKQLMDKLGLIPQIAPRYRSTYFNHIMGGYAAGYYSYIWAERLDTDAFEAFKEHGLFDQATATSFRKNILEKGGSDDPMKLYVTFRGAEPGLDALLKTRGLK
ncbi:M3 family metallopeptidase [Phocaeicola plebeius]|uniref:M3 family metallopeptidase n=1 Tax=Phocaeicola plebeius TaxID=310297 RepID=UPI0026EA780D|nr:M3 family metallopeptidase [Phocaeicola plebeius]MCI6049185.1 M3 family metallopeptidase [Phocaeicola plebeius]MDD6912864.1 M3 family metallopeptidase [Phocaeicola plebeius]MDY5977975.1 M3 family metallopeptidase [Phocaeicola plebeius]